VYCVSDDVEHIYLHCVVNVDIAVVNGVVSPPSGFGRFQLRVCICIMLVSFHDSLCIMLISVMVTVRCSSCITFTFRY